VHNKSNFTALRMVSRVHQATKRIQSYINIASVRGLSSVMD